MRGTSKCQYGNPSRKVGGICLFYLFYYFFSLSVKVLPVTPLVSGVFAHRALCAYFLRIIIIIVIVIRVSGNNKGSGNA